MLEARLAAFAVGDDIDGIRLLAEALGQHTRRVGLVLDEKQPHIEPDHTAAG